MMKKYYEINESGINIRCKMYYSENCRAEKAVIYGTGFAGHKDNGAASRFSEKLLSKHRDVIVIVFNWPSHGDDVRKKIVLEDCSTYLRLVIEDIRNRFGINDIYAYATSFGGYMILKYISENGSPFRKIALRCPAVDMYDVLTQAIMKKDEFEKIKKGKDVQVGFDRKILVTRSFLDDLKENDIRQRDYLEYADDLLILHGTKDEVVPFEAGREFAENNVIEFIPVQDADHRFQNPAHMSLANKYVMEFFFPNA